MTPLSSPEADETTNESDERLAETLEFVLAGRPDRLNDILLAGMEPAARGEALAVAEVITLLGIAEPAVAPRPALRARLLDSVRARQAKKPRKAVLVCDMINDHLTPGRVLEIPRARGIVAALAARLDEARAQGVPVVYVLDRHEENDPDLDEWGTHAIEGTEGADVWPALAPKPGDHQVTKPSFSGFYASDLERVLDGLGVDTVVLTGCATEVQLMTTATDALQRGYAVELPAGLHAGSNPIAEQVTAGVLAALVPYQPARNARLQRLSLST